LLFLLHAVGLFIACTNNQSGKSTPVFLSSL
jgi:hypothetical protein